MGQQKRSGQEGLCSVWVLSKVGLAERQESGHCEIREINLRKVSSPDTSCFCNQLYFDMQIPHTVHFVTNLDPRTLASIELIKRLVKEIRVNWYSSCCRKEQEENTGSFSGVRVGADPWSGLRAGLGGLPTPLVVLCAGIMPNTCSSPFTSEAAIRFCVFCVSLYITAGTAQCLPIFLACYSSFVFCCSRRYLSTCQVQALQYRNSGPSLSQLEMVHVDFVIKGGQNLRSNPALASRQAFPAQELHSGSFDKWWYFLPAQNTLSREHLQLFVPTSVTNHRSRMSTLVGNPQVSQRRVSNDQGVGGRALAGP